jgi:hypothetical protein
MRGWKSERTLRGMFQGVFLASRAAYQTFAMFSCSGRLIVPAVGHFYPGPVHIRKNKKKVH